MPEIEPDEIEIESRTQTPETIAAILEGDDYAVTGKAMATDGREKPTEAAVVAVAEPPVEEPGEVPPGAEDGEEPEPEPQEGHRKLSGAQRAKLKQQRLQDEMEALRRENASLKAGKPAAPPEPAKPAAAPEKPAEDDLTPKPAPNADDFADGMFDPAYIDARVEWRLQERERVKRVEAKTEADRREEQRKAEQASAAKSRWDSGIEAAKAAHEDFDEVWAGAQEMPVNFVTAQEIRDSEQPGELIYWLATHPDEAARIHAATLVTDQDTPRETRRKQALATAEIEKIEAALVAPASTASEQPAQAAGAPKTPVPKKPVPVDPVGARGGTVRKKLSEYSEEELRGLDSLEYVKLFRAEYGRNPY